MRATPFLELADDNTFVNKKWGKAFLRAIAPLGIRWFTETDISIADDEDDKWRKIHWPTGEQCTGYWVLGTGYRLDIGYPVACPES